MYTWADNAMSRVIINNKKLFQGIPRWLEQESISEGKDKGTIQQDHSSEDGNVTKPVSPSPSLSLVRLCMCNYVIKQQNY